MKHEQTGMALEVGRQTDIVRNEDEPTIETMMYLAVQKGPEGVESLERLVALKERMEDREAEKAMAAALAAFQRDCPAIPRVKTADVSKDGRRIYTYTFAPLEEIVRVIHPHLTAAGLSFTHDGEVNGQQVKTTCTLHHVMGAKRTATFIGPVDNSGGKNAIQQIGSARSYGRRYTLMDVLGLVTEDDDDGAGAGTQEPINDEQAADLQALVDEIKPNVTKMLQHFGVQRLADLPASRYAEAVGILEEHRRRR